ncbi:hypothetical protein L1987_79068 [Smallanthus sonchifolius]|uniref:Uncharacterized protein n=1 Tax=Smallanthus sonchifolius TaxID=185202 RepID=A0ACB8ZDL0_9ASTR|nr:hypothetical protein L1987_79068 [Smallanthus sonchifolius]
MDGYQCKPGKLGRLDGLGGRRGVGWSRSPRQAVVGGWLRMRVAVVAVTGGWQHGIGWWCRQSVERSRTSGGGGVVSGWAAVGGRSAAEGGSSGGGKS